MTASSLHADELVEQARELDPTVETVDDAVSTFFMHGFADDQAGSVDEDGFHAYRVNRWVNTTDEQGFTDVREHGSVEEAEADMRARHKALERAHTLAGEDGWLR